jgi:hypothetical protein
MKQNSWTRAAIGVFVLIILTAFILHSRQAQATFTATGTSLTGDSNSTIDVTGTLGIGNTSTTSIILGQLGQSVTLPGNLILPGITGLTQCLQVDTNGKVSGTGSACGSGGGGSPAGSNTQIQFNNSGAFGASAALVWTSPTLTIGTPGSVTGQLALAGATSGITILQPAAGASGILTLPAATGNLPFYTGSPTTGNCISWGSGGQVTDSGSVCGSSGTDIIDVKAFGAIGDARTVSDGAMSSTVNPTYLSSASAAFTSNDVGKAVTVVGAGAAGVPLTGTISSVSSSTVAVLSVSASTTVSGAVASIGTDNAAAIQSALTSAGSAGGGAVFVPKGTYYLTNGLTVPSSVHFYGASTGGSYLLVKGGSLNGRTCNGATWQAGILMCAVSNVEVDHLTVDLNTNQTRANGIEAVPDGSNNPATNITIQDNQVFGWNNHMYLIFTYASNHIKVIHNYINGNTTSGATDENAMEMFGGTDVLFDGNTSINNVQGLSVFTNGVAGTTDALNVTNNYIYNANIGLNFGSAGGYSLTNVTVTGNIVETSRTYGINVTNGASTTSSTFNISNNEIQTAPVAISIAGTATSGVITALAINSNNINNCTTTTLGCITGSYFSNSQIQSNTCTTSAKYGFLLSNVTDSAIRDNQLASVSSIGMNLSTNTRLLVENNYLDNWDTGGTGQSGIVIASGADTVARGNRFVVGSPSLQYAIINASSGDRQVIYDNKYVGTNSIAHPWMNTGTNPNIGTCAVSAAATTCVVSNTQVSGQSMIRVEQEAGAAQPFVITRSVGTSFTITIPSAAVGNEVFRYEITE